MDRRVRGREQQGWETMELPGGMSSEISRGILGEINGSLRESYNEIPGKILGCIPAEVP